MTIEQGPNAHMQDGLVSFLPDRFDFELTVEAARILGMERTETPDYEDVVVGMSDKAVQYLGKQAAQGEIPAMIIHLPLYQNRTLANITDMFERFVRKTGTPDEKIWGGVVYHNRNWPAQSDTTHNSDMPSRHVGFELRDIVEPYDEQRGIPAQCTGLVYGGMTAEEQVARFADEKNAHADQGLTIGLMTVSEFLVRQTKQLLAGDKLPDGKSGPIMRCLQYESFGRDFQGTQMGAQIQDGGTVVGLGHLPTDFVSPRVGLRRVLRS